jgi:hypothetical protein
MHDRDCCFGLPIELFETVSNKQTLQEEQPEPDGVALPLTQAVKTQRKSIPIVQPLVQKDVHYC